MKQRKIKGIALLVAAALLLIASIAVVGTLGDVGIVEGPEVVKLRELIAEVRVWYVGYEHPNPLYLATIGKMRGVDVLEVKQVDVGTLIKTDTFPQVILLDGNWVRVNVGDKDFHRLLQSAAAQRAAIIAIGGNTSALTEALHKTGVYEMAVDDFGNPRNPARHNPILVGFRKRVETLPDGQLNWFPHLALVNSDCPNTLVRSLIEVAKYEQIGQIWPDRIGIPSYVWLRLVTIR